MKRILVWDLPVRLFHWLLAASFFGAFAIGNLADDGSSVFPLHMLLGAVMAFMVMLRLVWGFVGSRHARFGSFVFGPMAILEYLKDTVRPGAKRWVGHNPGSSVAIWAMFALTIGLALTGAFMSTGPHLLEELHEVLAWALAAVVGTHVAGVIWHTVRHRENIIGSMVTGYKDGDAAQGIASAHPLVALGFVLATGAWAGALVQGYDAPNSAVTLPLLGTTVQLGEGEHGGGDEHGEHTRDDDD